MTHETQAFIKFFFAAFYLWITVEAACVWQTDHRVMTVLLGGYCVFSCLQDGANYMVEHYREKLRAKGIGF